MIKKRVKKKKRVNIKIQVNMDAFTFHKMDQLQLLNAKAYFTCIDYLFYIFHENIYCLKRKNCFSFI